MSTTIGASVGLAAQKTASSNAKSRRRPKAIVPRRMVNDCTTTLFAVAFRGGPLTCHPLVRITAGGPSSAWAKMDIDLTLESANPVWADVPDFRHGPQTETFLFLSPSAPGAAHSRTGFELGRPPAYATQRGCDGRSRSLRAEPSARRLKVPWLRKTDEPSALDSAISFLLCPLHEQQHPHTRGYVRQASRPASDGNVLCREAHTFTQPSVS